MNATGKKRKFTMAKKLSVLFALTEMLVNRVENTVVRSAIATKMPAMLRIPNPPPSRRSVGYYERDKEHYCRLDDRFHHVLHHPAKVDRRPRNGRSLEHIDVTIQSVQDKIHTQKAHSS